MSGDHLVLDSVKYYIHVGPKVRLQILHYLFHLNNLVLEITYRKYYWTVILGHLLMSWKPQTFSKFVFFIRIFCFMIYPPPHYARAVTEYLQQTFPQPWFGRRGNIEWPPRWPDTNGFLFFGCSQEQDLWETSHTVNELKEYISDAFTEIHRCSSNQIFGGAKDFCPNFSKLTQKVLCNFCRPFFSVTF